MWQLHQREGIAAGFDDEPLDHLVVQRSRQDGLQERAGVAMTEPWDGDLRQPTRCVGHFARGEHHRDPLDREAARREPEDLCRRAIEPLGVVDHAEKRPFPGGLRQQSENREGDEERVRRRPRPEPEGDIERVALRTRQSLTEGKDRRAELLDRGERELHLALDAGGAHDPQRRGFLDQRRRGAPSCRRRARHGRRVRRHDRRGRTPPAGRWPLARVPGPATALGVSSMPSTRVPRRSSA